MRVYFEDGKLDPNKYQDAIHVDAALGIWHCKSMLEYYSGAYIYTNSPIAFDNKYVWDKWDQVPDIHIRNVDGRFVRIDYLTHRDIHEGTNIWKLYLAGEFNPHNK